MGRGTFAPRLSAAQIPTGLWAQLRRNWVSYAVGVLLLAAYNYAQYYIDLLLAERCDEAEGFRHAAPGAEGSSVNGPPPEARGRQRWVINKLRALCAWYTKGIDSGSGLRVRVNAATSIDELRAIVHEFFLAAPPNVTSDELLSSRR